MAFLNRASIPQRPEDPSFLCTEGAKLTQLDGHKPRRKIFTWPTLACRQALWRIGLLDCQMRPFKGCGFKSHQSCDLWHSAKHAWPTNTEASWPPRLSCQNNSFRLCSAWMLASSLDALILLVALLETEPAGWRRGLVG